MIKINYNFEALSPIHTGADTNTGTLKEFRKQKVALKDKKIIKSKFKSASERRKTLVKILHAIWSRIDLREFSRHRLMRVYGEFERKLLASTGVKTKEQWVTTLANMWDITLEDSTIIEKLSKFSNEELFELIRTESQFLVLYLRYYKDKIKNKNNDDDEFDLFYAEKDDDFDDTIEIQKTYDYVPVLSSNGIRGSLRDLMMYDYCERVGINKENKLKDTFYSRLFSGGVLKSSKDENEDRQANNGKEDIQAKENLFKYCPPAQLLGLAMEDGILHSQLIVGIPRLVCLENGNGDITYWNYIDTVFGTRFDDLKKGDDFVETFVKEIVQMKYEFEVIIQGSVWEHYFILRSGDTNDVLRGAFYKMLKLFVENPYVGGLSSGGFGKVDLSKLEKQIDKKSIEEYEKYLESNKDEIRNYLMKQE